MANWKLVPAQQFDRRERVAVEGGWLVKEWNHGLGQMRFVADADHVWDGRSAEPAEVS